MPPHPDWPPEFLALIGSVDEEFERPPQQPVSSLRDPFEGFELTDERLAELEAWLARLRATSSTRRTE